MYTTYYDDDGNYVQQNTVTGQIQVLKWAEQDKPNGIAWMTRPDGSQVGYDPVTGAVLAINEAPADTGTWQTINMGGGEVIQVNSMTGETRTIAEADPAAAAVPKYIGQSGGNLITQNPDGTFAFTPVPGSRSPGSAVTSSSGGSSAARAQSSALAGTKMQIAAQRELAAQNQAFQGAQNQQDRQLSLYNNVSGQRFQGGENQLGREQDNAQFGANFNISRGNLDLNRRQLGLQGAQTYASLVSTPDLAALPAFLQAGGGNVLAGIAGGNDMLTQNANMPAALALQQLRTPFEEVGPYTYTPGTNPNIPDALPMPDYTTPPPAAASALTGGRARRGMAGGGFTTEPEFLVGDRMDGMPSGTEEMIVNPTGAPIQVIPNRQLQMGGGGPRLAMPRFAAGTGKVIADASTLTPGQNFVVFTDGTSGWVNVNGSTITDAAGAPVTMGTNTIGTKQPGTVSKGMPSQVPAAGPVIPRGFTPLDPSAFAPGILPAGGYAGFTYAENQQTGQLIRIGPDGRQYSMGNMYQPNAASSANFNPTPASAMRPTEGTGNRRWGANRTPVTPAPVVPPVTPPVTPPAGVDTPAGTVTPDGAVSQTPPATPAVDNSIGNNLGTVDDFRRNWDASAWNPMAANYFEQDPNIRAINEYGVQTRYGIPLSSSQNTAQRLRLPGLSRSNLAQAV